MTMPTWLSNALTWVKGEFTSDEEKVVAYLQPLVQAVISTGKTDILTDIANGLPTVTAALVSGGETAAVTAAETVVKSVIEPQAIALGESAITGLAASLAASAAASAAPAPTPAPTPTPAAA